MSEYAPRMTMAPNPAMAMLRAVILKSQGLLRAAWSNTRIVLRFAGSLPATLISAATTLLSTSTGYTLVRRAVKTAVTTVAGSIKTAGGFLSRIASTAGRILLAPVGLVSSSAAAKIRTIGTIVGAVVTQAARQAGETISSFGRTCWQISHDAFVRSATVTAAAVSPGLSLLTKIGVTKNWSLLAASFITTVAIISGIITYWRRRKTHANQPAQRPEGKPEDHKPDEESGEETDPTSEVSAITALPALEDLDWDAIAASVYIEITPQGALLVHGIPETVPEPYVDTVADIASTAAVAQLRRTIRSRPTPSRDDKRLFTKVAKEALRSQAHRQAA